MNGWKSSVRESDHNLNRNCLLVLILLALCGCRYSVRSVTPAHIKRVQIIPFENQTDRRDLSADLMILLKKEFRATAGVKIVSENPDGIITGKITKYKKRPLIESTDNRIIESQLIIQAEISFYDKRKEKWIIQSGTASNINTNNRSGIFQHRSDGSGEDLERNDAIHDLAKALVRVIETGSW